MVKFIIIVNTRVYRYYNINKLLRAVYTHIAHQIKKKKKIHDT